MFSSEVFKDKFLFFKKTKIIMISNTMIYVIDKKRKVVKKRNKIDELLGFTKSLIRDS